MSDSGFFNQFLTDEVEPPKKEKKARSQTVELTGIEAMRTLLWARTVIELADCAPSAIQNRYNFQQQRIEFPMYAKAQRTPSVQTLVDVEEATPVGRDKAKLRPFAGTRALFEVGPEGVPLWKVLEGSTTTCESVLDTWLTKHDDAPSAALMDFPDKIDRLVTAMLPAPLVREMAEPHFWPAPGRFSYGVDVSLKMQGSMATSRDECLLNEPPTVQWLTVALAAWQLAYARKTKRSEADLLLLLSANDLERTLPHIHLELAHWLVDVSAEVILTPGAEVKLTPWAMMAAFGRQDVDPGAIIGDSSTGPSGPRHQGDRARIGRVAQHSQAILAR